MLAAFLNVVYGKFKHTASFWKYRKFITPTNARLEAPNE